MFFNLILPPIIFAAGYNLHKKNFFDNFWIISYHGIVCTVITFIILSFFAFLLNEYNFLGVKMGEDEILLFTATLCATV
jgi:NhaP-type Na+/H+ or K+/H+ antiporter